MFLLCEKFNSDLSKWNVSKVTDMYKMFDGCKKFDSDLNSWDVGNVTDMHDMFWECNSLKNKPSWYKE
jgi:surface protein